MNFNLHKHNPYSLIGSIIYPFGALAYAVTNLRKDGSKITLLLFITFFGYIFLTSTGADSTHYAELLEWAHTQRGLSFEGFFSSLGSHDNIDYFNPLFTYIISRFTSNAHIYFMTYAFIWGLFYVNSIYAVLNVCHNNFNKMTALIFAVFAMVCSINDFGGIRMPFAFQLFLYGVFAYYLKNKKSAAVWVVLSMFVHFSMFVFVILFFIFLIIKELKINYFFIFFIIAHILNSVDMGIVQTLFSYLPGDIANRLTLYTNEANMELMESGGKFYLGAMNIWGRLDSIILRMYILVNFILLFLSKDCCKIMKQDNSVFVKFSLFIYGSALILANMPSGYRFILPAAMICMAYFILIYNNNRQLWGHMRKVNYVMSPFLVVFLLHRFRFVLDQVGISLFCSNYITMFFMDDKMSVLNAIKSIL